jgi:hypothetical protein
MLTVSLQVVSFPARNFPVGTAVVKDNVAPAEFTAIVAVPVFVCVVASLTVRVVVAEALNSVMLAVAWPDGLKLRPLRPAEHDPPGTG